MTPPADCKNLAALPCLEQFRRIEERIGDIQAGVAEIRTIYEAQQQRLDRAERTLYGDGAAGLCTKVSAILWITTGIAGFLGVLLAQSISSLVSHWFRG